jgi:outer membrane protein
VGVGVALPIFDRGAVAIARQRAKIELANEKLALRDQVQGAELDVRRAYLSFQSAQEQLTAADAQQKAAALALDAMQSRYRVGLATFVEVTLARATLVQGQSAVVTSRSSLEFQQALMSYYTGVLDASGAGSMRIPR